MQLRTFIFLLGLFGLWNFHRVFGESDDSLSILDDIRKELDNLKLSNERMERKIIKLEQQVDECHTKYAVLDRQVTSLVHIEQRIADIERKVNASHEDLLKTLEDAEMTNATKGAPRHIADGERVEFEVDIANDDSDNVSLRLDSKDKKSHMDKRIVPVTSQPPANTRIAFTAYLSNNVTGLHDGHTMPFDSVNANEGQGFNPRTHIFTCPVTGMYHFANALYAPTQHYIEVEIVKNDGSRLVHTVSGSRLGATLAGQGYNSVMNVCHKGTSVWVRVYIANNASALGGEFTTFSGFLLWEL